MGWFSSPILNGEARVAAVEANVAIQYAAPTTGQTVVSNGAGTLIINPAGTLATLTITLPASPVDGQAFGVAISQVITALTVNGGTIRGAPSTTSLNAWAHYKFSAAAATWFKAS